MPDFTLDEADRCEHCGAILRDPANCCDVTRGCPARHTYAPRLRPAAPWTLPAGVQWEYIEAPWDLAHQMGTIPRSSHRHGLIATDRQLTPDERRHFDLEWIGWTR